MGVLLYNSLLSDTYVYILKFTANILKYGHLKMKKSEARALVYYSYFPAALKKKKVSCDQGGVPGEFK